MDCRRLHRTAFCPSTATMKSRYWTDQNCLDSSKAGAQSSSVLTEIIQIHIAWSQTWPFLVSDDWFQLLICLFDRKVSCQQANQLDLCGCQAAQQLLKMWKKSSFTICVQPREDRLDSLTRQWQIPELSYMLGHITVALNCLFINYFIKILNW